MEPSVSVKLEEESIIFHAGQQMTCIVEDWFLLKKQRKYFAYMNYIAIFATSNREFFEALQNKERERNSLVS